MPNPQRDVAVSNVSDRENLHSRAAKTAIPKPLHLTRRPALDELSNNLIQNDNISNKNPQKKVTTKATAKCVPLKSYSQQQLDRIVDPDASTRDEPNMVTEYVNDIYEYLRQCEKKFVVNEDFLEGHRSTPKMRAVLLNWLVDVHSNFKLALETIYLTVALIDRYLEKDKTVDKKNLQLVGTAALFIASKYEEVFIPGIDDFVFICDDTFTKENIFKMESTILRTLEFRVGQPLSIHFLRRYSKVAQVECEQHVLAKYLLELAILEHTLAHIKPSVQAAAACCLSIAILTENMCPSNVWTPTMVHYTTLQYSHFKIVMFKFAKLLLNAENLKTKAIQKKYSASAHCKISTNPKLMGTLVKKLAGLANKS